MSLGHASRNGLSLWTVDGSTAPPLHEGDAFSGNAVMREQAAGTLYRYLSRGEARAR